MLKIRREDVRGTIQLEFSGEVIEDTLELGIVGELGAGTLVRVVGREVSRINSAGVIAWIRVFRALTAKGIRLSFADLSPVLVSMINVVPDLLCGGAVESIYAPFFCEKCQKEIEKRFTVAELRASWRNPPPPQCPACGKAAVFDDLVDQYFAFLGMPAE